MKLSNTIPFIIDNYRNALGEYYAFRGSMIDTRSKESCGMKDIFCSDMCDGMHDQSKIRFYKTPIGNYYLPTDAPHDCIANHMKAGLIFEPHNIEIARKYITKDSAVIDVGANFGQMTIMFSKLAKSVYTFEADDFVYYILRKNIKANDCKNVNSFLCVVYDHSNDVKYYQVRDLDKDGTYGSYGIDPLASSGKEVKTLAIDDLNIKEPISFMKVDAEGCDLFVMRGAIKTIQKNRMPILFEFKETVQKDFGTSFTDYQSFIDSIGYRIEKIVSKVDYLIVPMEQK